jgi:hypothetical protein
VYDNAHLSLTLPSNDPGAESRLAYSLAFSEADGQPDSQGWIRTKHRGLRVEYSPETRRLRVRGSLHTFAHGDNLDTFAAPDVGAACAELSEVLAMPADWLIVHKLEVGVNLPLPTSPRPFLESLTSHKGSPFTALSPPKGASRPLAYGAHHAAYRLKLYDKGAYSRLQGRYPPDTTAPHLLRYELVYERQRPMCAITGLTSLTLADLPRPPVMNAFATHLRTHWNLTQRRQYMNYNNLSLADAALLHAAADLAFWDTMRATQPRNTYARNRSKAANLLRQRTAPHPYEAIFNCELERLTCLAAAA